MEKTVAKPSKKLEALALQAYRLDAKVKELTVELEAAKKAFIRQHIEEDMFDKSTKAIGAVRTVFTDNRYFDMETALALADEEAIKESTVEIVDAKLLKDHLSKLEIEKCMKTFEVPLKVSLKPNVTE